MSGPKRQSRAVSGATSVTHPHHMPELRNTRQEKFCVGLVDGKSAAEAYRLAGFRDNRSNAASLARRQHIRDRVAELRALRAQMQARVIEQVTENLVISKETVILELGKIGFASMRHYTKLNEDGHITIDLSKATDFQMSAIQELTIDEYTEGKGKNARPVKRTKIKLYDKRAALVEIGKELGLFSVKEKLPFAEQVRQMTPDQRAQHAASLAERADRILRMAGKIGAAGRQPPAQLTTDAEYEEVEPAPEPSEGNQ
jgi:phage terminase small subunit